MNDVYVEDLEEGVFVCMEVYGRGLQIQTNT